MKRRFFRSLLMVCLLGLVVACSRDIENVNDAVNTFYIDDDISLDVGDSYGIRFREGLIPIKKNNKEGFMDKEGNIVIEPVYDGVGSFSSGVARVINFPDNLCGYIDTKGNSVTDIKYGYTNYFSEGYGLVCKGEIESLTEPCFDSIVVDSSGNEVLDSSTKDYLVVGDVKGGLISAKKGDNWGFVDINGNIVIDFKYKSVGNFDYEYTVVRTFDGKNIVIDKNGNEVLDVTDYDNAFVIDNSLIEVQENNKTGFIDIDGVKVTDIIYDYGSFPSEGYLMVSLNQTSRVINLQGKEVLDLSYYEIAGSVNEGFINVSKNNKCGYVNLKGEEVISLKYDFCGGFSEGVTYVKDGNKEMFIDKKGKVVLTYK